MWAAKFFLPEEVFTCLGYFLLLSPDDFVWNLSIHSLEKVTFFLSLFTSRSEEFLNEQNFYYSNSTNPLPDPRWALQLTLGISLTGL